MGQRIAGIKIEEKACLLESFKNDKMAGCLTTTGKTFFFLAFCSAFSSKVSSKGIWQSNWSKTDQYLFEIGFIYCAWAVHVFAILYNCSPGATSWPEVTNDVRNKEGIWHLNRWNSTMPLPRFFEISIWKKWRFRGWTTYFWLVWTASNGPSLLSEFRWLQLMFERWHSVHSWLFFCIKNQKCSIKLNTISTVAISTVVSIVQLLNWTQSVQLQLNWIQSKYSCNFVDFCYKIGNCTHCGNSAYSYNSEIISDL